MRYGNLLVFPQLGMALASQNTLENLSLVFCRISISKLVTLINNFPSLVRLKLERLGHGLVMGRPLLLDLHRSCPSTGSKFLTTRISLDSF